MRQYEVVVMVPTYHIISAPDTYTAGAKACAIAHGFDNVKSNITGFEVVKPILLGAKEIINEHNPPRPSRSDASLQPPSSDSEPSASEDFGPAAA